MERLTQGKPAADGAIPAGPPGHLIRPGRTAVTYLLLVVVPAVAAVALLSLGSDLVPHGRLTGHALGVAPATFPSLLIAVPVILIACQAVGVAFRRLGQPEVVGQIAAGFILGPSVFGPAWHQGFRWLFPASLSAPLSALAQLGLILFMFIIGYELNPALIRGQGRIAVTVSHVSIAIPFVSGILLAIGMYRRLAPHDVGFIPFALFCAISLSITAFPVAARILQARGMAGTPLGTLALTCAATDDVTGWCLLAIVVAAASAASGAVAWRTIALAAAFAAALLGPVRSWLRRLLAPGQEGGVMMSESVVLPLILCAVLLCAFATSAIGIQPIFGAFLIGLIMPRRPEITERAVARIRDLTVTLLLPMFFVSTGLQTKLGLLGSDWYLWAWCGAIILTAVAGKGIASAAAARLSGMSAGDSLALGALMNCRGLTGLIVLNVGLSLKVISPTMFTMLVVNALVATVMTVPLLTLADRLRGRRADRAVAPPAPGARLGPGAAT
jgi:Kef-type K+ transport system membrane component KefB